jgi:pimeloyl-ACP methyl ester carboxylesterase
MTSKDGRVLDYQILRYPDARVKRVVSVDRPGIGFSSPSTSDTFEGYLDDIRTLLDALRGAFERLGKCG